MVKWYKTERQWDQYVSDLKDRGVFKIKNGNYQKCLYEIFKDNLDAEKDLHIMGVACIMSKEDLQDFTYDKWVNRLNQLACRERVGGVDQEFPLFEYSKEELAFMYIIKKVFERVELD